MTTVVICKDQKGSYRSFYCMGHANYAKPGTADIVCAAVSSWAIGTVNGLEELAGEKISVTVNEEDGFLKCDFVEDLQEKSVFLMDTFALAMESISKEYGKKYLQVRFEEV